MTETRYIYDIQDDVHVLNLNYPDPKAGEITGLIRSAHMQIGDRDRQRFFLIRYTQDFSDETTPAILHEAYETDQHVTPNLLPDTPLMRFTAPSLSADVMVGDLVAWLNGYFPTSLVSQTEPVQTPMPDGGPFNAAEALADRLDDQQAEPEPKSRFFTSEPVTPQTATEVINDNDAAFTVGAGIHPAAEEPANNINEQASDR